MAQFVAQMIYDLVTDAFIKDSWPLVGAPLCNTNYDILDDNGVSFISTYGNAMWLDAMCVHTYILIPDMTQ